MKIIYRDDKTENFRCTDYPAVSGDWVTVFDNLERVSLAAQGIKRVEVGMLPTKAPRGIGFSAE